MIESGIRDTLFRPDLDELSDPLLASTAEMESCARALDLEDWIVLRLKQFEQETSIHTLFRNKASFPGSDSGSPPKVIRPVTALWVQHSRVLGTPIVPLCISGEAYLNVVRAKAMRTTFTCALYGVKAGGGAAAIVLDPSQYSEDDLREGVARIGRSLADISGPAVVIPDGTNPIAMEWLKAAIQSAGNQHTRISGRPFSPEERAAKNADFVGFGLAELIRGAAGHLTGLRVAIQGFDSSCQSLAQRLHRAGARVVGVADASGGVFDPLGLDPSSLISYVYENEVLVGYPGAEGVVNADLLECDCDVLVLATGARQLGSHNASRVRAEVLVEAVSHAITASAKKELSAARKIIASDLLCNGLPILYYATQAEHASCVAGVEPYLRRRIRQTWQEVHSATSRWHVPVNQATELLALQRVAEVLRARGI